MPKYRRGDILLDDDYCRLYIVLEPFPNNQGYTCYNCIIVCDWSMKDGNPYHRPNHPGERVRFGNGVEMDRLIGSVELPPTL